MRANCVLQTGGECRWRVSPGHTRRVLLILPRLSLPPDCSASFTVSRSELGQSSTVFSSCSSTQHPLILTGQSNNLWVEFKAGHKSVAQGFQLTVLSVQGETQTPPLSPPLPLLPIFLSNLSLQRSWDIWWTLSSIPGRFKHLTQIRVVAISPRKTRSFSPDCSCCSIPHIKLSHCNTRTSSSQISGKLQAGLRLIKGHHLFV